MLMGSGLELKVTLLKRSLFFYFKYLQKQTNKQKLRGLHKYLLYVLGEGGCYFFSISFSFLFFIFLIIVTSDLFKNKQKTKKRLKPMKNITKPTLEALNSLPEACDQQVAIGVWLFVS